MTFQKFVQNFELVSKFYTVVVVEGTVAKIAYQNTVQTLREWLCLLFLDVLLAFTFQENNLLLLHLMWKFGINAF